MKYKVGDKFILKKNKDSIGTIIKLADIDEFGCDFHYSEINYVVKFDTNDNPIASYNISYIDNGNLKYNYVMTENDIILVNK